MAKISIKSTTLGDDKTLILDPREGLILPLPFTNWTNIKIGMYWSTTTLDNDNASVASLPSEVPIIHSAKDRFFFGLKGANDTTFPYEDDYFWGAYSQGSFVPSSTNRIQTVQLGTAYPESVSTSQGTFSVQNTTTETGTSNFAGFLGVQYVLGDYSPSPINIPLASDVKALSMYYSASQPKTDTRMTAMRDFCLQTSFTSLGTSGVEYPRPVKAPYPRHLFVYWPFMTARLRIHSIGAFQIA